MGHSEWSYSSHWWNKKPPGTIRAITATGPFISFITDVDQKSRCHGAHTNPEMLITHPYFQTATKQAGSSKILSEAVGLTLTNSPSRLGSFIKCNFIISLGTSHPLAVRIPYHPFIICFFRFSQLHSNYMQLQPLRIPLVVDKNKINVCLEQIQAFR